MDKVNTERKKMPPSLRNRIGQRHGLLEVKECVGRNDHRQRLWRCQCRCGKMVVRTTSNLVGSRSCGCTGRSRGSAPKGQAKPTDLPNQVMPEADAT